LVKSIISYGDLHSILDYYYSKWSPAGGLDNVWKANYTRNFIGRAYLKLDGRRHFRVSEIYNSNMIVVHIVSYAG